MGQRRLARYPCLTACRSVSNLPVAILVREPVASMVCSGLVTFTGVVIFRDVSSLRVLTATRYVQPLREGGSLPAIVDTDSRDLFVAKFRGAGQGAKALIAEVISGILAHNVLPIPEIALID